MGTSAVGIYAGGSEFTVHTEPDNAAKLHGLGDVEACVSDGVSPLAECGESVAASGVLGVGKMMVSNTSGGTDMVMLGCAMADGCDAMVESELESAEHCCVDAGPAP